MARAGREMETEERRSGRKSYPLYDSPLLRAGARRAEGRAG